MEECKADNDSKMDHEVKSRPNLNGAGKRKDDEWCCDIGEDKLGDNDTKDIISLLVRAVRLLIGGQE